MDNLLSIVGMDPGQINVDSNVRVTQDHIDQLFAGVQPLLEKYYEDNPLMCDAECQQNQTYTDYYNDYLAARDNLINAPEEFEEAEQNFFSISESGQSYVNFKESQAQAQVDEIIQTLSQNFDEKVNDIQDSINNLTAESISGKYMKELGDSYGRDINQIDQQIIKIQNKNNINDRLAVYYNRQIAANKDYLFYIRTLYWVGLTIYICYFLIYNEQYLQKKKVILCILLLLIPIILKPIVTWLFPIKIYIPPPPPVCPTKPSKHVPPPAAPPTPPASNWVPPAPPPPPICPTPSIWSVLKNSIPHIGPPNARINAENRIKGAADDVSHHFTNIANRIKKII